MHHTKNDLSELGLEPRIVIETREKWLSFALGFSQIPGNFQNFTFYNALANYPPQSKITLSYKKFYPKEKSLHKDQTRRLASSLSAWKHQLR
jgi:hypothetical protein